MRAHCLAAATNRIDNANCCRHQRMPGKTDLENKKKIGCHVLPTKRYQSSLETVPRSTAAIWQHRRPWLRGAGEWRYALRRAGERRQAELLLQLLLQGCAEGGARVEGQPGARRKLAAAAAAWERRQQQRLAQAELLLRTRVSCTRLHVGGWQHEV